MSVRSAAIWAMGSQYTAFTINFFASVYLARLYIGPDELGLFSIAFAAATLIAVMQDFGLTRYIAGSSELDDAKIRTAFSVSITIAWIIALVSIALAWPMAALYDQPRLFPLMLIIGASYFIVPFAIVPTALRQRAMDFKANTLIEVGAALANAVVSIGLAQRGYGAIALAWGAFAQQIARVAISQWRNGFLKPWPLSFGGAKPMLRFGGGSSLLLVSGSLGGKLPDLLIGQLINELAVGLFARGTGLAAQLRMLASGAVAGVFYPAFARIRDRGEALGPPYERVVACYCAVTWPAMAGLAVLAEPLIRLLYGERWIAAALPLQWIAVSQLFFIALPLHVELPILMGKMRPLVLRCLLDTAISIALLALGASMGLEWAAASRVAYGLAWVAIFAGFLHRLVGFDWGRLFSLYARTALATLAAIAPALLFYDVWDGPRQSGFAQIVASGFAGLVAWLIALWFVRHPALGEIVALATPFTTRLRRRSVLTGAG